MIVISLCLFVALILIFLVIRYRFWLKDNQFPTELVATLLLICITAIYVFYSYNLSKTSERQISLQTKQFNLTDRPYVYTADWSEFKKSNNIQTIGFKLENCGNLPARYDSIFFNVFIGSKKIEVHSEDFFKPAVIFPNQKNIKIDLPIHDILLPEIRKNLGLKFEFGFTYFSFHDTEMKNQYSYYIKYDLLMKSPHLKDIGDYILLKIEAS